MFWSPFGGNPEIIFDSHVCTKEASSLDSTGIISLLQNTKHGLLLVEMMITTLRYDEARRTKVRTYATPWLAGWLAGTSLSHTCFLLHLLSLLTFPPSVFFRQTIHQLSRCIIISRKYSFVLIPRYITLLCITTNRTRLNLLYSTCHFPSNTAATIPFTSSYHFHTITSPLPSPPPAPPHYPAHRKKHIQRVNKIHKWRKHRELLLGLDVFHCLGD